MRWNKDRPAVSFLVLGATLILSFSGLGAEQANPVNTGSLIVHFGISWSLVEGDQNRDDVLAATKIWAATVGIGEGLWQRAEARLLYSPAELLTCVNGDEVEVVAMTSEEYLELEKTLKANPSFTYVQAGHFDVEYVMLVHSGSGINALRDLQGMRAILLSKGGRNSLAPLWCNVMLGENGFPDMKMFFRETKEVTRSSQAVLPVFFKQIDAAIVPRSTFETAASLNPQVGQQLKVLAASPLSSPW